MDLIKGIGYDGGSALELVPLSGTFEGWRIFNVTENRFYSHMRPTSAALGNAASLVMLRSLGVPPGIWVGFFWGSWVSPGIGRVLLGGLPRMGRVLLGVLGLARNW